MFNTALTFLYKNIRNRKELAILNTLKKRSIIDINANVEYQKQKLTQVLEIAFRNVPFYKNFASRVNLDSLTYERLQYLPFMDKNQIRKDAKALINPNFDLKADFARLNSSGGSTGEPVKLYRTGLHSQHGIANYYYALHNNGVSIYQRSIDLWGAEQDMYRGKSKKGLRQVLNNNVLLNTFVLSDEIISNYVNQLIAVKPLFIKAYVHSVYEIAKYILKNNIDVGFSPIIHCTTGPLYPEMREVISKAFGGAYVYNFYGSREVSAIASEVKNVSGLYVLYDNVFLEIIDSNGKPVREGEEGEVVVTTLNNFYMPLIRYRIGDRAIKGDNLNFGTLVLDNVVGRTLGVIHKRNGSRLDGQFFTTLFFGKEGIKSFQLIQKSLTVLNLKIVKGEQFSEEELYSILERIECELGEGIEIEVQFCDKIDLTSTGKIMYVYSEL